MSRSALVLALFIASAWPGLAAAQAAPQVVAASADPLGEIALRSTWAGLDPTRCATSNADVTVCGRRSGGGGVRVPYEPEPGARVRPIAGEPPSMGNMGCLRLCEQPLMVDLVGGKRDFMNGIARGIGRLLHPD
jgi:hypothetical protein